MLILILVFVLILLASGTDLIIDLAQGVTLEHVVYEALVVLVSIVVLSTLTWRWRQQARELQQLKDSLDHAREEPLHPNPHLASVRQTFSVTVHEQFQQWQLSASETEIGWLLLKGLSLKEIAALRNTAEKTVRQQASAIYSKAGVSGRHAFAAWFFEDLL